jgi:rRNA maturation endonuclease Nob1
VEPDELLQSPLRADQTSRSFCPRCHAQFTAPTGICQDCGGVALVTFSLQAKPEQAATWN